MLDYTKLGDFENTKARRFMVIGLMTKRASPPEIEKNINKSLKDQGKRAVSLKTIYRDMKHIKDLIEAGDPLPPAIARAHGEEFYEQKIRELEAFASQTRKSNPNAYLGAQKELIKLQGELLKLQGASVERIEHTGIIKQEVKIATDEELKDFDSTFKELSKRRPKKDID